jgi:hypothetical protein
MFLTVSGISVLLLVLYVLKEQRSGPTHESCSRGYHQESDDMRTLLDRIEWSSVRTNRVNYVSRYLIWGLWVTFLGTIIITEQVCRPPLEFLRNWITISVILLGLHGYYDWHSDKFSTFTTLEGVKKLRSKMGVKKSDLELLSSCQEKFSNSGAVWTFTQEDHELGTEFPYEEDSRSV